MKNKGFTLVELMIVIAIIAIIAAVAIPSLLRSRISANESSAVSSLRTLAAAEIAFAASRLLDVDGDGIGEFSANMAQLFTPPGGVSPPFLPDDTLANTGTKSGYLFTYVQGDAGSGDPEVGFQCNADPVTIGSTGITHFYVDESTTVRFNAAAVAGPLDPPVG